MSLRRRAQASGSRTRASGDASPKGMLGLLFGARDPAPARAGFGQPDPRTGTVLVELRTANGVALVEYACSARVVPLNSSSFCSTRRAPAELLRAWACDDGVGGT